MKVIINGDDFGMTESCSLAIAKAFELGFITDTTMVANGDYFDEAVAFAREDGFSDRIGVHLNITEGEPLTENIKSLPDFVTDGCFNKSYDGSRELNAAEREAIYLELTAQVERIKSAGISVTHADSHHYVHNMRYIAPIAERVCAENGIRKLRLHMDMGASLKGDPADIAAYNSGLRDRGFITADHFLRLRDAGEALSGASGTAELLTHPDFDKNGRLIDRTGMADGYPSGEELTGFFKDTTFEKLSYKEL